MWWWVGAGLAAVLSVVCVPAITNEFIRGKEWRQLWTRLTLRYGLHTALGALGLWLALRARG